VRISILAVTGAFLAGAIAAQILWYQTGNDRLAVAYVQAPGAAVLVALPAAAAWLSHLVSREFSRREPLLAAWRLITGSAFLDFCGQCAAQVLAVNFRGNPVVLLDWWSPGVGEGLRQWGLFLSGPCRFALLALALYYALEAYRRSGFLGRFGRLNWLVVAAIEAFATAAAIWQGKGPGLGEIVRYPTDPLLFVLLIEAMLLYNSALEMGGGWVGSCWKSMGVGVFLVSTGDMIIMATNYGYLIWPWTSIGWYVWFPAAAAFAIAPTYQLDAVARARSSRNKP
jgi:hypothetical protein